MLVRDEDGSVRSVRVAPVLWSIVEENDEGEPRAWDYPTASRVAWKVTIVGASDAELAAMREHGILPEQQSLWVEENGIRHRAYIDFAPLLIWGAFGAATAQDIDEGAEFSRCRIVAASPADVKLLRRFGFSAAPGLDELTEAAMVDPDAPSTAVAVA